MSEGEGVGAIETGGTILRVQVVRSELAGIVTVIQDFRPGVLTGEGKERGHAFLGRDLKAVVIRTQIVGESRDVLRVTKSGEVRTVVVRQTRTWHRRVSVEEVIQVPGVVAHVCDLQAEILAQ